MKVGQVIKIDLKGPHTETVLFNNNQRGDTPTEELYLELLDSCSVSAVGYGLKSSTGIPLKFIDIANLSVAEAVEDPGIYMLMCSALEKVEISFDANASIDDSITCRALIKTVYGG